MTTLIQQRMAVDRAKNRASLGIWGGAILGASWLVQAFLSDFRPGSFALASLWILVIALGVRERRKALKAEATFNAEHGTDAGVQKVIPRTPKR